MQPSLVTHQLAAEMAAQEGEDGGDAAEDHVHPQQAVGARVHAVVGGHHENDVEHPHIGDHGELSQRTPGVSSGHLPRMSGTARSRLTMLQPTNHCSRSRRRSRAP